MQYNYDLHLHYHLVDASHMLGEFKSFYYNRNIHNGSWCVNPNFLPAPHLIWCIDSPIPGKGFLIAIKNINGGRRKFLYLHSRSEKTSGPISSKVDVMMFLQYHDLIYEPFDS